MKRYGVLCLCTVLLWSAMSFDASAFPSRFAIESASAESLANVALIGDGLSAVQALNFTNWGSIQTNAPLDGVNKYEPFPSNSWWAGFLDGLDATDRGLLCTLSLGATPWAIERNPDILVQNPATGKMESGLVRIFPEYTETWQDFIKHLLSMTPQITHLQIDSEAENIWVHAPGYIEALRLAYDAVHAFNNENPGRDVKVLAAGFNLGELTQVPEDYLQMIVTNYPARVDVEVLREFLPNASDSTLRLWSQKLHLVVGVLSQEDPAAPSFDILSVHHDGGRTYDSSDDLAAWYRQSMAGGVHGAYDRPIWVDDMSSNYHVTSNGNVSVEDLLLLNGLEQGDAATIAAYNAKHPAWLVKKAVGHFAAGIERVSIAYGQDIPDYFLPIWRYMGLFDSNLMLKPAYYTARLMVEKLDGFTSATRLQQADTNIYLYRFSFAAKPDVFVAWRENEGIMDLSAYVTVTTLRATHLVMEITPQGDAIWPPVEEIPTDAVALGPVPVFLEAADSQLATYAVSYDANGATSGTAPASQTKTNGVSLTLASNSGSLARTGYTFAGWNTVANGSGTDYAAEASYTVNAAVTLYAKWTPLTYAVTYDANGATSGTTPASQTKINDVALTLASNSGSLARTGYTFSGWNTAANGSGTDYAVRASYTANEAITLYAKWTPVTFAVTYIANGATSGTAPASQAKTYDIVLTLQTNSGSLAKTGYTFAGWNTAANGKGTDYADGASYTANAAVTLYAKWTPLTYAVTYDANGATSGTAPASQTKTNDVALTLASNSGSLARTGYTFAGWNTAANGSGTDYAVRASYTANEAITLYAKWTVNTYAVTYDANGATNGTAPASQTKTYGVVLTLQTNSGSLAKTGYTFAGWNTAANGTGTDYSVEASYTVNAAVTLYAKWNVDSAVYRFWSDSLTSHFFTINTAERDHIIANSPDVWTHEGVVFYVHGQAVAGSSPVHRFWSDRLGCHVFTISESEKTALQSRYSKVFTYEGIAWHAFAYKAPGTLPVYRFWAPKLKKLFLTISEAEKDIVIADMADTWSYKGIAWYGYAYESPPANATASIIPQSKANTVRSSVSFISEIGQAAGLPGSVTFGLSYGADEVVSAMVHDPAANTFMQVLEPTLSPRELVIPALPFGQRYWLSVMSHHLYTEKESLDYGGWLGRVSEVPAEEMETVAISGDMALGLPVEHIVLPETDDTLALRLYSRSDNRLIQTVTGLKGGSTYELGVQAWNQWYRLEIVNEASGAVIKNFWIGHLRTH